MTKKWTVTLGLVSVGLTGLLIFGVVRLGVWVFQQLLDLNPEILAALIATSGTIIAGVVAVVLSQQHTKKREIAEAHRPKKVEIYSRFLKGTIDLIHRFSDDPSLAKRAAKDKELRQFFVDVVTDLVLWGSPDVILSYSKYREVGLAGSSAVLLEMDVVFREIRKDLGHSNAGLRRGDLMKLFLTDPANLDKVTASSKSEGNSA